MENEVKALENMGVLDQIPRAARYAVLRESGATQLSARDGAGYSPNTTPHHIEHTAKYRQYRDAIRAKRQELSIKHGLRIEDSASFYDRMSRDHGAANRDRIRAREVLDKLMGYFAPVEVERTDDEQQRPSISILAICQQYNVSPAQLLQSVQAKSVKSINNSCNNATPAPNGGKNGVYPIKDAARNNNYVNLPENSDSDSAQDAEIESAQDAGGHPPQKKIGPGGGSDFETPCDIIVPPPYHAVGLI